MTEKVIKELCIESGFDKAEIIDTDKIIFDAAFRPYCEENLCGQYGANYSCPPDCGTPEEMKEKVLAHKKALVLKSVCDINDFSDSALIKSAKQKHNAYTVAVIDTLQKQGYEGFMIGSSGCSLCSPCLLTKGQPCQFPNKMYSCMSAYCIYVKDLAEKCGMEYDYKHGALPFFSMYVFNPKEERA